MFSTFREAIEKDFEAKIEADIDALIEECNVELQDFSINESIGCDAAKESIIHWKEQLKKYKTEDKRECREKESREAKMNCLNTLSDKIDNAKDKIKQAKDKKKTKCLKNRALGLLGKAAKALAKKAIGK